ncbi:Cupin domain-containing protein [Pseudonocardia ammonioxydans]|uniref:Cupin domain-containing protein n=1 Tax=Pseudonocardia ammonioxydans TaxID=260086 RepID=A0A1I4XPG0_PSUAM|nr:cupin domain-containing protein [Pseudonocardia ammonioxydans]SFN27717.1 Cupin domain-containing protein [Pseudonocardia ammonioxydans]
MELCRKTDGLVRKPPIPDGPVVTVVFGGDEGGPDVGLVRAHVPPGGGMPAHSHGGSDVVLTVVTGRIRVADAGESVDVEPGDSLLVRKDETVSLTNPGDAPAEVLVAAGPTDFLAGMRDWPEQSAG